MNRICGMMAALMLFMSAGLHADLTVRKSVEFASVMTGINHSQEIVYVKGQLVAVYDSSESYANRQLIYNGNRDQVIVINHDDQEYTVYNRSQIDSMISESMENKGSVADSRIVMSEVRESDQDSVFQGLKAHKIEARLDFCCLKPGTETEAAMAFRCRARGDHWICGEFDEADLYSRAMSMFHDLPSTVTGIEFSATRNIMSRFGFPDSIASQLGLYQNSLGLSGETNVSLQIGQSIEKLCDEEDNLGITFNTDLAYKLLEVSGETIDSTVFAVPDGYDDVENALGPRYDIEIPGLE